MLLTRSRQARGHRRRPQWLRTTASRRRARHRDRSRPAELRARWRAERFYRGRRCALHRGPSEDAVRYPSERATSARCARFTRRLFTFESRPSSKSGQKPGQRCSLTTRPSTASPRNSSCSLSASGTALRPVSPRWELCVSARTSRSRRVKRKPRPLPRAAGFHAHAIRAYGWGGVGRGRQRSEAGAAAGGAGSQVRERRALPFFCMARARSACANCLTAGTASVRSWLFRRRRWRHRTCPACYRPAPAGHKWQDLSSSKYRSRSGNAAAATSGFLRTMADWPRIS